MTIVSIGGGPSGLFFAILMKRLDPAHRITVVERNGLDDTFGWGVVFSDETLGNIAEADPKTYDEITRRFAHWDAIDIHYRGEVLTSHGHGFSGLSRQVLLNILQQRAKSLGVELVYGVELRDLGAYRHADLILGADGVNSRVRELHAAQFEPKLDWRPNKFIWLGTTRHFDAFTFLFKETEHGLWRGRAYLLARPPSPIILLTPADARGPRRARRAPAGENGALLSAGRPAVAVRRHTLP